MLHQIYMYVRVWVCGCVCVAVLMLGAFYDFMDSILCLFLKKYKFFDF